MCTCIILTSPTPDPDDVIVAPPEQYAVNGSSYTLQCSVEDSSARVEWISPGSSDSETGPYIIDSAGLHHEGEYVCEVYFSNSDLYHRKTVQLSVVGMCSRSVI